MRVIEASLKEQVVEVILGSTVLADNLEFASVSSYQAVSPGTDDSDRESVEGGTRTRASRSPRAPSHTLVVLDGASGLEVVNLEDASGSGEPPRGRGSTASADRAARPGLADAVAGGHRSRVAARPDRRAEAAP